MGNCIICGKPVDGLVCSIHEEDVAFEFHGTSPSQLSPGRYYEGTVDGFADFGVFVDIGDRVTGLLHRSELDKRLENLDWDPGETVYVQVLDVRDNGNVDLGWSIRQRDREFRGKAIETPDGEFLPEEFGDEQSSPERTGTDTDVGNGGAASRTDDGNRKSESTDDAVTNGSGVTTRSGATEPTTDVTDATESSAEDEAGIEAEAETDTEAGTAAEAGATAADAPAPEAELNRTTIGTIADQVGSVVRLEGEITGIRQTTGPTVFELRDETGTVECAAFEEAGVRAYPAVEVDDVVALEGEVERHHGDLQIETEVLEVLDGETREAVADRLEEAIEREARPSTVELLADHAVVSTVEDEIVDAATAIRRAIVETRPVVIRHSATADGYVAGAALERAILPLVREKHTRDDAEYHYVERRPLDGRVYDMDAATDDVTSMLEARDRHGEQLPLVILVDAGSTVESIDGYELLSLYGADCVVIDDSHADQEVADAVSVAVAPSLSADEVDLAEVTSTVLGANVAVHVNDDVRDDLVHLPAVSYWEGTPETYADLAVDAGYDETALSERREAIALEAYYQSYKDKRELVADLLFDDDGELAAHVSGQFRAKLETELETARENLETREVDGLTVAILDTVAFVHRYDFPTIDLLLDALDRDLRRERDDGPFVTLGLGQDELRVRASAPVDVREIGEAVADAAPTAGVSVVGGRDGHVEFLTGERETVRDATLEALSESFE